MLIFAHRGASGHEPENTLSAIQLALDMQCDGIEVDVHQVEDQLIVIHDAWLHNTTNGQGKIHHHSFASLRALDAGKGQQIPTLREVFECVAGQAAINIEVKSIEDMNLVLAEMDHAVAHLGFDNAQLLLSSFNHHLLQAAKRQRPQTFIGALTASLPVDYAVFAQQLDAYSINCDIDFVSREFVADAHRRGLKFLVYTANDRVDVAAMKALGVDGIFTNFPTQAMAELAHQSLQPELV